MARTDSMHTAQAIERRKRVSGVIRKRGVMRPGQLRRLARSRLGGADVRISKKALCALNETYLDIAASLVACVSNTERSTVTCATAERSLAKQAKFQPTLAASLNSSVRTPVYEYTPKSKAHADAAEEDE
jgi:transposase-like protein